MARLNQEREKNGQRHVKPGEVFDLIGGTSTGGLIAIMLGRLGMDVDDCISAYTTLMSEIFKNKKSWFRISWNGKIKAAFDSKKLRAAIQNVIARQHHSGSDLLCDDSESGCKVFVCATAKETNATTHLRSYVLPNETNIHCTISEAALATSAATSFFKPVEIGHRVFVDGGLGGLGVNNPSEQVETEAGNIWSPMTGDPKRLVKCFISIGTGNPGRKPMEDNVAKFLSRTLVDLATHTEAVARRFESRWRQQLDSKRYFRFNVQQGLESTKLDDFQKHGAISAATELYLQSEEQKFRVRDCVLNLIQKSSK
ncbi:hypothetical protein MBLNU459_g0232t2 [Dothideomycetes sp. NU459]